MSQSFKGLPLVCDFGNARFADQEHESIIMPGAYRAPEVVMQTKWNQAVDIWSFGMVISLDKRKNLLLTTYARVYIVLMSIISHQAWHIVSPALFFSGRDPETNEHHDGHLIADLEPCSDRHRQNSCTGAESVQSSGMKW